MYENTTGIIYHRKEEDDLYTPPSTLSNIEILRGNRVLIDKEDLIFLLKLSLPDMAFIGIDSNNYLKFNEILEVLENEN